MTKSKWLKLHSSRSLKSISMALSENPFDADTGQGFELINKTNDNLLCKFSQRTIEQEEITDPFGTISNIETIRYTSVFFLYIKQIHIKDYFFSRPLIHPAHFEE